MTPNAGTVLVLRTAAAAVAAVVTLPRRTLLRRKPLPPLVLVLLLVLDRRFDGDWDWLDAETAAAAAAVDDDGGGDDTLPESFPLLASLLPQPRLEDFSNFADSTFA